MKKVFLSLVMFATTMVASAQIYLGGQVGFWDNNDSKTTTFQIMPEIGYTLSEKWSIGTTLGYTYLKADDEKGNAFNVAPYARYTFAKLGMVSLFLDGGFSFETIDVDGMDKAGNAWSIGIQPGLYVNLSDNLKFVSKVGFLGYCSTNDHYIGNMESGFGLNLDANNITIGLLFNF